jgi:hypothetical protein
MDWIIFSKHIFESVRPPHSIRPSIRPALHQPSFSFNKWICHAQYWHNSYCCPWLLQLPSDNQLSHSTPTCMFIPCYHHSTQMCCNFPCFRAISTSQLHVKSLCLWILPHALLTHWQYRPTPVCLPSVWCISYPHSSFRIVIMPSSRWWENGATSSCWNNRAVDTIQVE